jgi:hypothetical protein
MEAYNNEDPRSGADGQVFDKPDNLHCLNYSSVKLMHANKMQQHWISIKIIDKDFFSICTGVVGVAATFHSFKKVM